jgi:hypothetical protein
MLTLVLKLHGVKGSQQPHRRTPRHPADPEQDQQSEGVWRRES